MSEFIALISRKVIPLFLVASIAIVLVLFFGRDYYQPLSGSYVLWKFPDEPGVSLHYKDGDNNLDVLDGPIVAYFDSDDYIVVVVQDSDGIITQQNVDELGLYVIVPLKKKLSDPQTNHSEPLNKTMFLRQLSKMGLAEPAEFVFIDQRF